MTRVARRSIGPLPWPAQGIPPRAAGRAASACAPREADGGIGGRRDGGTVARAIRDAAPRRGPVLQYRIALNGILHLLAARWSTGRSPCGRFPHRIRVEHPPIANLRPSEHAGAAPPPRRARGGVASGSRRNAHHRLGSRSGSVPGVREDERLARRSLSARPETTGNVRHCTNTWRLQRTRSGGPVVGAQWRTIRSSTSPASCINGDAGRASGGTPCRVRDLTARAPFGVQRDVAGSLKYRGTLLHPKKVPRLPTSEATFRATFRLQSGNNTSGTGS